MKKFLCILSLSFLICINAQAACIEGDYQNVQGTYFYANGNKEVGEWRNSKAFKTKSISLIHQYLRNLHF